MKPLKPNFTISQIGKFRFDSGIAVGIGYSLILNLFFRLTLKLSHLGLSVNERHLNYQISAYCYYLIGFISIGFAFCYTTYLWISKPFACSKKKTPRLRMGQINSIWIFYGTLLFLLRLFWVVFSFDLKIENHFSLLWLIIPISTYLYCWNSISNIYKTKNFFPISFVFIVIGGFILSCI